MPSYETTIITKPNAGEDIINTIKAKVESVIGAHTGTVALFEDWGTRRMTYDIQKENRGRYIYFGYTANTQAVAELERNLRINENVVRYLSVQVSAKDDLELVKQPSPMKRAPRAKPLDDADHYE